MVDVVLVVVVDVVVMRTVVLVVVVVVVVVVSRLHGLLRQYLPAGKLKMNFCPNFDILDGASLKVLSFVTQSALSIDLLGAVPALRYIHLFGPALSNDMPESTCMNFCITSLLNNLGAVIEFRAVCSNTR